MEDRRKFLQFFFPRLVGMGIFLGGASWVRPFLALAHEPASSLNLGDPRYAALISELVKKHRFETKTIRALFEKVELQPDIIEKFDRPPELLPYYEYRRRFISDELIAKGQAYLHENRELLQKVEETYGVPKEVICSILGVETRFGQPGIERHRAFDVLNTAFSLYPRREAFFRDELINFVLLCREENLDPLSITSSYAGAFGVPQFMPSSFRRFAVDFDRDGKKDLWSSKGDIFASVANYLKEFGWKQGGRTRLTAETVPDSESRKSFERGIRNTVPIETALQMGVQVPVAAQSDEEVSFAFYQPQEGREALLVLFENFRAITRYNFSVNYALTVTDLSEILASPEAL